MANARKEKSPYNIEELEQLKKDVEYWKTETKSFKKQVEELTKEKNDFIAKNIQLEKSTAAAYEKIKALETANDKSVGGETAKSGYVEIATMPFNDTYPPVTTIEGVVIPRKRDEDGIMYETIPVGIALSRLNVGNAFKRYFVGPGDKIEGLCQIQKHGNIYKENKVFLRHKKSKDIHGNVEFIPVTVEESK